MPASALQCVRFQDPEILRQDPRYALGDLFQISCAAEQQFLNLVQSLARPREKEPTSEDGTPRVETDRLPRFLKSPMDKVDET